MIAQTYTHNERAYMRAHTLPMTRARAAVQLYDPKSDVLTLMYLREWYKRLPAAEKAQQPALVADLVLPWYERGRHWQAVTMKAHKVAALTPYEKSPPILVTHGQGAVQPKRGKPKRSKRKRKAKSNAPEPAHENSKDLVTQEA